jgi:hypothetical protein
VYVLVYVAEKAYLSFFFLTLQVNDFLSGRAPLVLGMRVSDHIVFIQLQLSTYQSRRHHRPPPVRVPPNTVVKDHQEVPSPTCTSHEKTFTHNYRQYDTCTQVSV